MLETLRRWTRSRDAVDTARAVAAAVLAEFGFDVGFSVARGTAIDVMYLGLCGMLMLAAGLVCVVVAMLLPGPALRTALSLYVVLYGFADPSSRWSTQFGALAMGAACWVFLSPARVRASGAAQLGVFVAAASCIALVLLIYAQGVLGIVLAHGWQVPLNQLLAFTLLLVAGAAWETVRARTRILPPLWSLSAAALALAVAGTAYAFEHARPQRDAEHGRPAARASTARPDVFVLVLDTVRADHLSSYGYARDTTPNLTRFLADHPDAVQYDLVFSPTSWTVPSHASLLTGLMPSVHGAESEGPGETFLASATKFLSLTADETLAEILRGAGYCTAAVVANAYLLRVDGMQRGFDTFVQPHATRPLQLLGQSLRRRFVPGSFAGRIKPYPTADAINRDVLRAVRECSGPSFVLANYMDGHEPYRAPSPHAGLFASRDATPIALGDPLSTDTKQTLALKLDRYDEGIHYLDAELQALFSQLESLGKLQGAWVFVTADHGEAFQEHGTTSHGSSLYDEQVRIPLIVKPPQGVRLPPLRDPVSLLDVTATVAAISGRDGFGSGRDLRQPAAPGRVVEIEFRGGFRVVDGYGDTANAPARAVVRGPWKLIERSGGYELYDVAADPGETVDRASEHADLVRSLISSLAVEIPRGDHGDRTMPIPARPRAIAHDEEETLRALGYVK
jgi:arylsulfatase A-like enzyme